MIDLLPSQNGTMHHQAMLREAAERQKFAELSPEGARRAQPLHHIRRWAGKSLLAVGRSLAQSAPDAEPAADMNWKTS